MRKHTPGPWNTHVSQGLLKVNDRDVASVSDWRLIDASPDLLAALERLEREVDLLSAAVTPGELRAAHRQARAAIAKARVDNAPSDDGE